MPTYDYHCPANGRTIEVFHSMSATLTTWGDVCAAAEMDLGDTPANTPVERKTGAGMILGGDAGGDDLPPMGGCGAGCACHPG